MISSDGFWCSRGFSLNIAKGNQKETNWNFWVKKWFQHRGLISHVLAKRFIDPGGPPVFKSQKKMGGGWLITGCWLILTWHYILCIYIYIYIGWIQVGLWKPENGKGKRYSKNQKEKTQLRTFKNKLFKQFWHFTWYSFFYYNKWSCFDQTTS